MKEPNDQFDQLSFKPYPAKAPLVIKRSETEVKKKEKNTVTQNEIKMTMEKQISEPLN